jgi:hypothetical protein
LRPCVAAGLPFRLSYLRRVGKGDLGLSRRTRFPVGISAPDKRDPTNVRAMQTNMRSHTGVSVRSGGVR